MDTKDLSISHNQGNQKESHHADGVIPQPLGYKQSALTIELTSSKAIRKSSI